jgi:hypothetical protein
MYTPGPIHNNPLPNYREPKNFWLYVIIVVSFLIWLASMTSCYTPQKANRQALRAITAHPATVLPTFRSLYPCVTTRQDTFITSYDTIINIDCPDTTAGREYPESIPVRVPVQTRTITVYKEDSAKLKEHVLREQRLITEREQAVQREQDTAAKLSKTRKTRNWLWVAVIAAAVYITRKAWLPVVNRMVNPLA